jgi:dihydrofolate reductase
VRQDLKAGLIDSLHLASVPVLLGQGELLFAGLDLRALGFSVTGRKATEYATHPMCGNQVPVSVDDRAERSEQSL